MTDDIQNENSKDVKRNLPDATAPSDVHSALIEDLDEDETIDLAQAELISFYGEAPLRGPAWAQEAAQSRANFAQRIPGTSEWTIGNGAGSLSQLTVQERAEKEDEEALEAFESGIESVDREQERQRREREEWSRSMHSYAGIEMTGEEWGKFADELKGDTPLRKWLLEKLKKDGKTDEQAKTLADQMALLAKMQSLPPSQWTPEMNALNSKLEADPVLKEELNRDLKEARAAESGLQENGQKIGVTANIPNTDNVGSALAKADILSQSSGAAVSVTPNSYASTIDSPAIISSIALGEHHKAALAAQEPLDAPKQIAVSTPTPAQPFPIQASPGGGLEV